MKLVLNGQDVDFDEDLTVGKLLVQQNVKMPDMVSVELNGQILRRSQFEDTALSQGDKIEFLYFMGGGSAIY